MRQLNFCGGNNLQPIIKYIETATFLAKYFYYLLINVGRSGKLHQDHAANKSLTQQQ